MEHSAAVHALLFSVRRSVRYHTRRRMFFDRLNTTVNALSLIFGSATIYTLFADMGPKFTAAAAGIVTLGSVINLVVGSSRMARLHADLARQFIDLEKRMVLAGDITPAQLIEFTAGRLQIEADEPPVMRVLDSICHNELMRAMGGYGPEHYLRITWYQRLAAQFIDINDHTIAQG